ncbi:MAG: EF-P lysine aminoacylase GenX [Dehalococcoidales bacterium]|nr:EF-P lysine aminoacylase GenX [Dehalococcoidales bacterium]
MNDFEDEPKRLARLAPNLKRRALIYRIIRDFFQEQDFLEVETPVRAPAIAPEQFIVPFQSEDWFLAASPELHMKRLLASGYDRIFQFSRCFRKGERGRWHNPEFVMLEWYRKCADYLKIIDDTEKLAARITQKLGMGKSIKYQGQKIDISPPWPRTTVEDAYVKAAGWDPIKEFKPEKFDTDFVEKVLPMLAKDRPTVLLDYPAAQASLAKLKADNPLVAERAEVFIGGLELANAYSELADAGEQARRFKEAIEQIERERGQRMPLPEKFLKSVKNLRECGGIALGVDRLVMLFCDADKIDDVIAFTEDTA